jgi:glycosyltransferase involved in cell wall biosynthesis
MIDTVVCPSSFMEEKMKANPDLRGRTVMLRNFIDLQCPDTGKSIEDTPDSANAHNTTEKTGEYVLYFGRFSPEKGIRTLIRAARELPDIPFVFAGNGPYEEEVNEVPNITNKGFLTGQELTDTIRGAAFSLIASECFENCPFAVMESQMLSTPVIGADIGGIPELITPGVNGDLFASGDPEALKSAIRNLWQDRSRRETYTANCRSIHYPSLEEYTKTLLKVYQN